MILNVEQTLVQGEPCLDSWIITDEKELLNNSEILELDEELKQILMDVSNTVIQYILNMTKELNSLGAVSNVLTSLMTNKQGKMVFQTDTNLVDVTYDSILGQNFKALKKKDAEKIAKVIREILLNNIETDVEDDAELKKIVAEINYKVIDSLPNGVKVDKLDISEDGVKAEILKIKSVIEENDEDGSLDI